MTDQLISFETAKLAKEKGYNQNPYKTNKCYAPHPDVNIAVSPTQSLLQKWLRETYDKHVYVNHYHFAVKGANGYYYHFGKSVRNAQLRYYGCFSTYEEALEMGLQELLKQIKV